MPVHSGRYMPVHSGRYMAVYSGRYVPVHSGRYMPVHSGRYVPDLFIADTFQGTGQITVKNLILCITDIHIADSVYNGHILVHQVTISSAFSGYLTKSDVFLPRKNIG